MIQLNLLPDIKKDYLKTQQSKSYVVSIAIIATIAEVGVSILLFVYVNYVQGLQVTLLDNDIKSKTSELQKVPNVDKYLTVQNQLAALPELHDKKGVFSRMMDFLPVLNPNAPNNITLTNLQTDATAETLTFTGTAQSFQAMNVFVDTLTNAKVNLVEPGDSQPKEMAMFKDVTVQSGSLGRVNGRDVVSFMVQTAYNPPVFDYRSSGIQASIPNIKTSQSVTNSPTPTLFDQNTEGN